MKGFVKAGRVAKLFGVTLKTIHNWEAKDGFPVAVETPGGHRVFRPADVLAVLKKYDMTVPEDLEGAGDVTIDDASPQTQPEIAGEWFEYSANIRDVNGRALVVSWDPDALGDGIVDIAPLNKEGTSELDLPGIAALRRALDKAEAAARARVK